MSEYEEIGSNTCLVNCDYRSGINNKQFIINIHQFKHVQSNQLH